MSDYVESHLTLADHPKLRRFCRLLSIEDVAAVGHLHFLWYWAFRYAPDGDLTKFDTMDIADAARWKGDDRAFVDALLSCGVGGGSGFLDKHEDGTILLHDWQSYGGKLHVKRQKHAETVRNSRVTDTAQSQKQPSQVTRQSRDMNVTVTDKSCEALEERRGEENRRDSLSRHGDDSEAFGADAPGQTDPPSRKSPNASTEQRESTAPRSVRVVAPRPPPPAVTPDDRAKRLISAFRSVRYPKHDPNPTKTEWIELKATAKRMVSDGFTEDQVKAATAAMVRRFREIEMCTFFALAKHWTALTEADSVPSGASLNGSTPKSTMYAEWKPEI